MTILTANIGQLKVRCQHTVHWLGAMHHPPATLSTSVWNWLTLLPPLYWHPFLTYSIVIWVSMINEKVTMYQPHNIILLKFVIWQLSEVKRDVFTCTHHNDPAAAETVTQDGWHSDASVDVIGMSWTCWRRENCTVTQPAASLRAASRSHAPTTCRLTCYRRKYQKRHCIHASDGWLVDWGLTALLTQLRSYRTFKVNARYDLMKDITPHIQVLFYTSRFPITQNVRDLNAADSCIRRINHNLGSFWSLQQHTDGCLWLARYDFLLVCYNDFKTIPGL